MESSDEIVERFAHDVCVHVLEKFGIFKAPDDMRKQNKYVHHHFLPRISRSVVSFAIWIRTYFKNAFEDKCKSADFDDNEVMWIFEDQLFQSDEFSRLYWAEKVCVSLALCTEYVQFASTKDFRVSLNKLVIGWRKFFEEHLKSYFEENDGFLGLYNYLENSQINQLGEFQEAFISEYCLPYGTIECTTELAKKCMEKRGLNISLEKTIFGMKTLGDINEDFFGKLGQVKLRNSAKSEEPKLEQTCSGTSDSAEDSSSTSVDSVMEASSDIDSDSEISPHKLLGIPPHEDTLREIDPFFVENIPSPPKPQSSSKSPVDESGSSKVPRVFSKSPESETGSSEVSKFSSKLLERESGLRDAPESPSKSPIREFVRSEPQSRSTSKSPERESGSSEVSKSLSKSPESEPCPNDAPKSSSRSPERESVSSDAESRTTSKSPERETGVSNDLKYSSKSPERESGPNEVTSPSAKSSEGESAVSDACRSPSKSPEGESAPCDISAPFSKSPEGESAPCDISAPFSKSPEGESAPSEILRPSSKSPEGESGTNEVNRPSSKSSEGESGPNEVNRPSSKSPEGESAQSEIPQATSSKSLKHESGPNDAQQSSSKSPERESVPSDAHLQASPKTEEELKERVDQILTRLEHDMDELRSLLYENGLLAMKTGRRGSIRLRVQDSKDKRLPPGPEGLI